MGHPSPWPSNPADLASEEAMRTFQHRGAAAAGLGFAAAFPNFYYAVRNRDEYGGTILLKAEACEFRDVPSAALGDPNPRDFGGRMRATQDYAVREGFPGGFPTFHQADRNGMLVFGTVLLKPAHTTWLDVPLAELGNPGLDDIRERFKRTDLYASRRGFAGGLPTFYHADRGGTLVCGTLLLAAGGAERRDVHVRTLPA